MNSKGHFIVPGTVALDNIAARLHGREWEVDDLEYVAAQVRKTGRIIGEPGAPAVISDRAVQASGGAVLRLSSRLCSECYVGVAINQTYGTAEIPTGAVPVQCCDTCKLHPDDETAARVLARDWGATFGYSEAPRDDEDDEPAPGVWWVMSPSAHARLTQNGTQTAEYARAIAEAPWRFPQEVVSDFFVSLASQLEAISEVLGTRSGRADPYAPRVGEIRPVPVPHVPGVEVTVLPKADGMPAAMVDIPEAAWIAAGEVDDPPDDRRLLATVLINRVPHHLHAWKVEVDADGEPLDPQGLALWPDDLDHLSAIVAPDGPFQTVTIRGSEYILVAYPHV